MQGLQSPHQSSQEHKSSNKLSVHEPRHETGQCETFLSLQRIRVIRTLPIMMASNKRGPPTPIGDTVLELGEIFVMRVPYDMSEQEGTDPGTWTTSSRRSPPHHPCVLILRSRSGSTVELEFFVLRSFGGREPREVTKRSLTANEFLPLPYPSGDLDKTPAAFGEPLCAPGLRTESQTWLLIHPAAISVPSHTKVMRKSM